MPAWLENVLVIAIVAACAAGALWHFIRDMKRRRCGFGTNCFQDCVLPGEQKREQRSWTAFLPVELLRRRGGR